MNHDRMRMNSGGMDESGLSGGTPVGIHEQLELLMSRIADGEGSPADWGTFTALAARVPDAWEQLAKAQRDHAALSVAVGVALCAAERVELPSREGAERFAHVGADENVGVQRIEFWSRARTWGGWAAAAAIVLAWTTGGFNGLPVATPSPIAGLIPASWTPDDAYSAYLEVGKKTGAVLGEVPQRILVGRRQKPNGKWEATYLRQAIERQEMDEMFGFAASDEMGNPVATPVKPQPSPEAPQ